MNRILKANTKKRKYHKLPPCGHRNDICDMENCRLQYAIKNPNTKARIDENFTHRNKVIKRRREVDMMKLDEENVIDEHLEREAPRHFHGIKPVNERKLRNKFLLGFGIIITLPFLYIATLLVIDLIKLYE